MNWFSFLEIIGTISFAISGSMVAIKKKVDIFGVVFLGITTSFGGGLIRDIILGNFPPAMFNNTINLICAFSSSLLVFIMAFYYKHKYIRKESLIDNINNVFDAIGLGAFSIIGAQTALEVPYEHNAFLIIGMGMITGMGGGLLRDILVREIPFVLTKRVYAVAALLGASIYYILVTLTYSWIAMIIGVLSTFGIRILSTIFKWDLPKAIE